MCRVTFMDSTGAAFLISLADAGRKRGGATVLRGADQRDLFVIEICGALDLFRIDSGPPVRVERRADSDFRRPDGASAPA